MPRLKPFCEAERHDLEAPPAGLVVSSAHNRPCAAPRLSCASPGLLACPLVDPLSLLPSPIL
jgi:hypothetical protein